MKKHSIKAITPAAQHTFSLGLDSLTHEKLVELQKTPELQLKNKKVPSRTLITRMAIRLYSHAVNQAIYANKTEWLQSQAEEMSRLAHSGRK